MYVQILKQYILYEDFFPFKISDLIEPYYLNIG